MTKFGFTGNLFVNTKWMEDLYAEGLQFSEDRECMNWDEIKTLIKGGWQIGAHTHTHPNLSDIEQNEIKKEMEINDNILKKELGIQPKDFAFTGTSWSSIAEQEAKKRYRFGRLWIVGSMYSADGKAIRYADLVGIPGADENDGGPPYSSRYITIDTDPFKLPSMELEKLIYEYDAFKAYLSQALQA